MFHCYEENQRRLTIGEIDVRIPADVRVRITALHTHLHRVTNIERNNDADRSLAQQEAVSVQFCSSGLPFIGAVPR
jgi:hypothetical protein